MGERIGFERAALRSTSLEMLKLESLARRMRLRTRRLVIIVATLQEKRSVHGAMDKSASELR